MCTNSRAPSSRRTSLRPRCRPGTRLFGTRRNSRGIDLQQAPALIDLTSAVERASDVQATSIIGGARTGPGAGVRNPASLTQVIGTVANASAADAERAVGAALAAFAGWEARGVDARADIVDRVADAWEAAHDELAALIVREGGRTMLDAHLEVREAIDFCRYYAAVGRERMQPQPLPGPAGESNELRLGGRGVFVCISPWNFPLAIFGGQIAAALVAGNAVVAKPAEQTPLVAFRAVQLMHEAGVPPDVLHLVLGDGETRRPGADDATRASREWRSPDRSPPPARSTAHSRRATRRSAC